MELHALVVSDGHRILLGGMTVKLITLLLLALSGPALAFNVGIDVCVEQKGTEKQCHRKGGVERCWISTDVQSSVYMCEADRQCCDRHKDWCTDPATDKCGKKAAKAAE